MAISSPPNLDNLDGVAFLVGYPIAHSLSPLLHRTAYKHLSLKWEQLLYETQDLNSFLTYIRSEPKLIGSGVTMPYKVAVIPHLDSLTPEGHAIGAINTIFWDHKLESNKNPSTRHFIGTNTDCIGIQQSLSYSVSDPSSAFKGRPGLVVGGGGTCRASVYALRVLLGCSTIYIINRDASEVTTVLSALKSQPYGSDVHHVTSVPEAANLPTPAAIINAVPDFSPVTESEKTTRAILEEFLNRDDKGAMLEMCYHPHPETEVYRLGEKKGWKVVPGTDAMLWQGVEQARLWTGLELKDLPVEEARRQIRTAVEEKSRLMKSK